MIRSSRIGFVHLTLAVFALAVIGKMAQVQLAQGAQWRARADRQQYREHAIPAPRGPILDATGMVLAQSRETVQLSVAPREVNDAPRLRRALAAAHVPNEWMARAFDRSRAWVTLPGRYLAVDVAPAVALRGVYATTVMMRTYSMSSGTRGLVGSVDADGHAVDGIERSLDSLLRGTPGSATIVKDVLGRSFESPNAPGVAPHIGDTVVLTLNHDLQEIADRALADAVARMGAEGGDIVILDPQNGEVLAMASRRADEHAIAATALTEPFEPGSTMKPFMAAALLQRGLVTDHDSVDTGNGVLVLNGRTLHDDHLVGKASLASVLRWSSNVGMVKFSERLTPRQKYETLRDFGFGTATGVPYPAESDGILREPRYWSQQTPASVAIGYEVAVTPLQLATAYAAFANGGRLLEPALVKEIRAPDGTVLYRHTTRVVRQVIRPEVADRVRRMLLGVVEGGTALQADLSDYLLAGKTGTPRRSVNGHYAALQYNPNFVGLFPGDAPQYVIVVKLTIPQGHFYAAETAAPLTKAVLQAAIAARDAALNRGELASSERLAARERPDSARAGRTSAPAPVTGGVASAPVVRLAAASSADSASVPFVVTLPASRAPARVAQPPRLVPDVRGMPLREAVRSLHSAGFRVQLASGSTGVTTPASGTLAPAGTLVRLLLDH